MKHIDEFIADVKRRHEANVVSAFEAACEIRAAIRIMLKETFRYGGLIDAERRRIAADRPAGRSGTETDRPNQQATFGGQS